MKTMFDLVLFLNSIHQGDSYSFKNGCIEVYSPWLPGKVRGNIYLNRIPQSNFYIVNPDQITFYFRADSRTYIGYEPFRFKACREPLRSQLSEAASKYASAKMTVDFFEEMLTKQQK